ncbi:hypothetical protein BDV18DRAFT_135868 [Aspergillus unguis]
MFSHREVNPGPEPRYGHHSQRPRQRERVSDCRMTSFSGPVEQTIIHQGTAQRSVEAVIRSCRVSAWTLYRKDRGEGGG